MAKEVIMPKFGFTQEESEILEWLKNEGEQVEKGDPIAVVSTDKISMEVEAPETGTLAGVQYPAGSVVPVTEIIAYILQPGEELPTGMKPPETEAKAAPALAAAQPKIPAGGISPVAARIIEENQLRADEIIGSGPGGRITRADVETYLRQLKAVAGRVKATPAARREAKERQVNLAAVKGSGPSGRIQARDVIAAGAGINVQTVPAGELTVLKEIPLVGMRKTIAENMSRSMREAPHMALQVEVEVDAAENTRKTWNERLLSDKGKKISATAVIVKATALALKKHPILNSRFSPEKITLYKDINIGVATALDEGLIVPVIHSADEKDLLRISAELNDLAKRARMSKLQAEDLVNGTFTISNLGMLGIDRFTAIINPPQAAILAVGAIKRQLIPDDSENPVLRTQRMINLTLSADHRVMDGAQAAYFLADLRELLQNPEELFV